MIIDIEIAAVPNQSFEITLEGIRYAITFKACFDFMAATVERDGVAIVDGVRCCAGSLLIPFEYQYDGFGNFMFLTDDEAIPYWDKFGTTQSLIYYTADELAAVQDG